MSPAVFLGVTPGLLDNGPDLVGGLGECALVLGEQPGAARRGPSRSRGSVCSRMSMFAVVAGPAMSGFQAKARSMPRRAGTRRRSEIARDGFEFEEVGFRARPPPRSGRGPRRRGGASPSSAQGRGAAGRRQRGVAGSAGGRGQGAGRGIAGVLASSSGVGGRRPGRGGGPGGRRTRPGAGAAQYVDCRMMMISAKNVTPSMRAAAMIMAVWMLPAISG